MRPVDIKSRPISPYVELVGEERVDAINHRARVLRGRLGDHAVWNINSTAAGGGVAEMLRSVLCYASGLGIDVRWGVLDAEPDFFRITKRLHNALHDDPGDGSALGPAEAVVYERVLAENARALRSLVSPGDVVICHDPQTAGLVPELLVRGARLVWRCHIGHERPGPNVDMGWAFLRPYLDDVPVAVFSRDAYAPSWLRATRATTLPPNIDPFSVKNRWLSEEDISAILGATGLVEPASGVGEALFVRDDGTTAKVTSRAEVVRAGGAPRANVPLIVQVSRWDRMKDPVGVLLAFARLVGQGEERAALVLAGPSVRGVADDPEGPEVFAEVLGAWRALPDAVRARVHLAELPMRDPEENAAMVNALQRHATIIVQKSLREGFGLTVTEAMWKRRPVVASAVGGIQDQIRDGVDGLLIQDPSDPDEVATALAMLLADSALAKRLGRAAYERVREHYLGIASLERWASLVEGLLREAI